ncbi:UNVERIFIED_CONTAM: fluoroquinolone transport system permease protein [Acetivibrio alkalicellulosi]
MGKYFSLLKYESKTIVRDPINIFMTLFPILILILASFVFPLIFESMDHTEGGALQITMLLLLIVIVSFGGYYLSAMATFLLLDHKDEHTLNTIGVTPLGASGYVKFKMSYMYILTVLSTVVILYGTKLIAGDKYTLGNISLFDNIGLLDILMFSIVSNIFVPFLALFQSAFAKNKVEGFAYIKGTGMIALIPALMVLDAFQGGMQYVLGIFPNFWAIKGIMLKLFPINNSANLSYPMYLFIGAVYNIILLVTVYKIFLRKTQY